MTPATLAWEAFGTKNGASTEAAMRARIEKYRQAPPAQHGDYEIGCLMISQPVFFAAGDCVEQPRDGEAQNGKDAVQGGVGAASGPILWWTWDHGTSMMSGLETRSP